MSLNREETMKHLGIFWLSSIRYWERILGVRSDESKEPYIQALKEMGDMQLEYSPLHPYPDEKYKLDIEAVKDFIKYKKIDTYGNEWKTKETGGRVWK